MASLTVIYKGHTVSELNLNPDQEIWIGRDSQNDVVLDAPHGISRKHLKIFQDEDQHWIVVCESNLGGLKHEEKEVSEVFLEDQTIFFLQEFKFLFQDSSLEATGSHVEPLKVNPNFSSTEKTSENKFNESPEKPVDDKTLLHSDTNLQAQLVISIPHNESDSPEDSLEDGDNVDEQTVILKDQLSWVIGREVSCDICIEDRAMSREHIKIEKKASEYYVTDLNSSNGTLLNENKLKPQKPKLIKSGDVLKILDVKIYFDIINLAFKEDDLNLPVFSPLNEEQGGNFPVSNVVMDETRVTGEVPETSSKKRIFMIIGVFAIVLGGLFFLNQQDTKEETEESYEGTLTSEEQERLKDMYMVAQQLYQAKKYELCISKIEELHVLSVTEQSTDLQQKCINGQQTLISQIEIKKQKEDQEKIQKIIAENIKECTDRFSTFTLEEELRDCLAPTLNHDPENAAVVELFSKFEIQELEKKQKQEARARFKRKIDAEMKIYNQALALKEKGQILKAIAAYKKFLKRKHPEAVLETVEKARKELQEMETKLSQDLAKFMNDCTGLLEQKEYKKAHGFCKKALTVVPDHPPALAGMKKSVEELNEILKPIYEESVLNESLGRVDHAQKFWREIIEKDIPEGEYRGRAQRKLKKY